MKKFLLPASLLVAAPAAAQDLGTGYTPMDTAFMQNVIISGAANSSVVMGMVERGQGANVREPRLGFFASQDVRAAVIEAQARSFSPDPAQVPLYRKGLERTNYPDRFRRIIGGTGFRDDDLGDIFAAWVLSAWQLANDRPLSLDRAALVTLRAQLAPSLARNPANAVPANRAVLGERMKLQTVLLHDGAAYARDRGGSRSYADQTARDFATMGLNLRALQLTPEGLARR